MEGYGRNILKIPANSDASDLLTQGEIMEACNSATTIRGAYETDVLGKNDRNWNYYGCASVCILVGPKILSGCSLFMMPVFLLLLHFLFGRALLRMLMMAPRAGDNNSHYKMNTPYQSRRAFIYRIGKLFNSLLLQFHRDFFSNVSQ